MNSGALTGRADGLGAEGASRKRHRGDLNPVSCRFQTRPQLLNALNRSSASGIDGADDVENVHDANCWYRDEYELIMIVGLKRFAFSKPASVSCGVRTIELAITAAAPAGSLGSR